MQDNITTHPPIVTDVVVHDVYVNWWVVVAAAAGVIVTILVVGQFVRWVRKDE